MRVPAHQSGGVRLHLEHFSLPRIMVLLLFLAALTLLFFLLVRKHTENEGRRLPPSPPGLPVFGNLHQMKNPAPHVYLWQLSKRHGPIMSLRLGLVPAIVVSSARVAKETLKTHDLEFAGRPSLLGQQRLSYNGLDVAFTPYSRYWREMRKICVVHLFSSKRVQSFRSIREDEVSRMIQTFSKSAAAAEPTNLSKTVMLLSTNIICRIAFGKRYEDEEYENSRFHALLNEAEAMLFSFFFADYLPFMGWVDKLTGLMARLEKNFKELDLFYEEVIKEHLERNRAWQEKEDVTDILLRVERENLASVDLTKDHIKALLMNIFVAGSDTSAAILVWAMTELMKNPAVMKKAQEELRNVFGKKGFVDEDGLGKLPYLKALVKETLRFHPPAPLLVPRETMEKCTIHGYDIPPKTLVFVNAWAIARDPEAWENPEEFSPERFLGSSVDFRGQDYELIPFGAGRRACPGIHLGAATVELALANLLYSFNWEMPAGTSKENIDMDIKLGITMHKKNPLCLQPRQHITAS